MKLLSKIIISLYLTVKLFPNTSFQKPIAQTDSENFGEFVNLSERDYLKIYLPLATASERDVSFEPLENLTGFCLADKGSLGEYFWEEMINNELHFKAHLRKTGNLSPKQKQQNQSVYFDDQWRP